MIDQKTIDLLLQAMTGHSLLFDGLDALYRLARDGKSVAMPSSVVPE